jgi:putative NADH-flavin reductase
LGTDTTGLLENKYQARCIVRQARTKFAQNKDIDIVLGDIIDAGSLTGKLAGCDAVINLIGIIKFRVKELPLGSLRGDSEPCQGSLG